MDRRCVLKEGTILPFPGMMCTVESLIGKGSNAVVYLGSYPDHHQPNLRHRVLIKELFPYHARGGIYRNERNEICFNTYAAETMRLNRASFIRANEVHIRLLGAHPGDMDSNINTFPLYKTLYSVLGFSGGRSLDKELNMPGADRIPLGIHIRRMLGALDALELFHESGFLHLDLSPENILLIGEGKKERVSLIDYNSVHTLEEIRNGDSPCSSGREGYIAPEVRMKRIASIGFSSDLYAMTAVFYRCITGQELTAMQIVQASVPDIFGAKCLEGMPDTVLSMIRQILRQGLSSVGSRRYKNVAAMRLDLEELQDRINGKGITHWALWDTGRINILHTIKANPALEYVKDDEKLYPLAGTQEDGTGVTVAELFKKLTTSGGQSMMMLGGGGMGKTTALLRIAYQQRAMYSGDEPAVAYISLYGWNNSGSEFIKNKILENLRFKPETDSIETARHELIRLLSSPAHTKWGERPKLLLLLDGLNEATGDLTLLMKEITELSAMAGVRILLTTRSENAELSFPKVKLRQLEESEVTAVLSANGILPPDNGGLFQLLRTPMMLSIFVKTALEGRKQLFIDTQEQLLTSYLSSLLEKEMKKYPEHSSERWRVDAALYYVLPEMACLLHAKEAAASNRELLPIIEKCYRRLSNQDMTAVFPQWIGHLADIRGEAQNAEEWYGQMVHTILWRRLGLIIRDEDGNYRIVHRLIEEYLVEIQQEFNHKFLRRKRIRSSIGAALILVMAGAFYHGIYVPNQSVPVTADVEYYDKDLSKNVFDTAFAAYINAARQYDTIADLLDCFDEDPVDRNEFERKLYRCKTGLSADIAGQKEMESAYEDRLLSTGQVMPWSENPLNAEAYEALISLPEERADDYLKYIEILEQLMQDQDLWKAFGEEYVTSFREAIECDAFISGKYYWLVLEPELSRMENSASEDEMNYYHLCMKNTAMYPKQNRITEASKSDDLANNLESYEAKRITAWRSFLQNAAITLINSTGDD